MEGSRLTKAVQREIEAAVQGSCSAAREDRICYSFDATDIRGLPDIVVWPESPDHVVAVVKIASRARLPVVPRGAGTGYTGGSIPICGGIALSFEKMTRIADVNVTARVAVVEPGVVNDDLRNTVESLGLTYPPDPASLKVSTIGGNVAEGAAGPRTVLYGTTGDYVVGLELVTMDGSIIRTGYLASASDVSAAWDPGPLIVGSEGTLAVVTNVALRLTDAPEVTRTYWAEFGSLDDAAAAVAMITADGVPVSVLEIMDGDTLACATEYVCGRAPDTRSEGALLIEVEGAADDLAGMWGRLRPILESCGATGIRAASDENERDELWEIRRSISASLARLGTGKINEDIAVPRSRIPMFIAEMRRISEEVNLPILAFGHAGDGNLHVNIMLDRANRSHMVRAQQAVSMLFSAALKLGGTLSGEHGIGITKAEHLAEELDEAALRVTVAVRRALDPSGLLNPDKILSDRPNPWWDDLRAPAVGA
jgi:glycolate oxidase